NSKVHAIVPHVAAAKVLLPNQAVKRLNETLLCGSSARFWSSVLHDSPGQPLIGNRRRLPPMLLSVTSLLPPCCAHQPWMEPRPDSTHRRLRVREAHFYAVFRSAFAV